LGIGNWELGIVNSKLDALRFVFRGRNSKFKAQSNHLGFTHKDCLEKLSVKFTINAANHTLIVHDDRAQVPIAHDDIVVRDIV
jgi:hypothetical protein